MKGVLSMLTSVSKRVFAILMSILLLFGALAPCAFAAEDATELDTIERTCPTIYIHGFACGNIYSGIGTENESIVWPMQGDVITQAIETALAPIANYLLTHNWAKFEDALIEVVNILFSGAWNNADGSAKDNQGIKWQYPREVNADSILSFNYDWRGDPIEIADELAAFIDYVLEKSGCEKVAIECHSMGGIIFISYLAKYGLDKIQGAIMDSTAIYGASYMGELFANRFVFEGDAVYFYLLYAFSGMEGEAILDFIMDSLFAAGTFELLEFAGQELVRRSYERVARDCLIPLFGYWPSIWAMIPDADCAASEEFVFETLLEETEEHEILRNRVRAYNEQVRSKRDTLLQELAATGRLMVITRYGYTMAPVSGNWNTQSDGVIDTVYSSFGATTAAYGDSLSDDYIAENSAMGYISPDKMVDASSCAFPEVTWFIKDLPHSHGTDSLNKVKYAVLFADQPITVQTFNDYPQYMIKKDGRVVAYESYEKPSANPMYELGKIKQSIRDKIIALFIKIYTNLASIFSMPA